MDLIDIMDLRSFANAKEAMSKEKADSPADVPPKLRSLITQIETRYLVRLKKRREAEAEARKKREEIARAEQAQES